MKASRIFVIALGVLASVCMAAPARAEINTNFVKDFLARYRPSSVVQPGSAASAQALADLTRNGQLPLTMGDLINLMLQNNLDINVDRLSPLSSQYLIATMYRPFEPTIHVQASVNRSTTPATTVLAGAANPSTLGGSYNIGFAQTLATGSVVGVDATMSRSSSNSNFSTLNPSWTGSLHYSFTQHLCRISAATSTCIPFTSLKSIKRFPRSVRTAVDRPRCPGTTVLLGSGVRRRRHQSEAALGGSRAKNIVGQ